MEALLYHSPAYTGDAGCEEEALSLENGILGCKIFGGIRKEWIQLIETIHFADLWILLEGKTMAHDTKSEKKTGYVKGTNELAHPKKEAYIRGLNAEYALAWTEADIGSWRLRRDCFVSNPAQVFAVRQTGKQMNLTIYAELTLPVYACEKISQGWLFFGNTEESESKFSYFFGICIETDGSVILEDGRFIIKKADYVTVYASFLTDHDREYPPYWNNKTKEEVRKIILARLETAVKKGYETLFEEHLTDYGTIDNRKSFRKTPNLPESNQKTEPSIKALMYKDSKELAREYLPVMYLDAKEPFPIYAVGYTIFRSKAKSPSAKRVIDPASNHAAFCIEYTWYYDYDIQHLYDLEHTWVYVDENGQVCGCESSFHGKFFNSMLHEKDILHGGKHVHLYVQPGKHAIMPDPYLFGLFIGFEECCKEQAGIDGILTPEIIPGMPRHSEKEDNDTEQYLKDFYGFVPSNRYAPCMEQIELKPWEELCAEIPGRVCAGMEDIAAWAAANTALQK